MPLRMAVSDLINSDKSKVSCKIHYLNIIPNAKSAAVPAAAKRTQ